MSMQNQPKIVQQFSVSLSLLSYGSIPYITIGKPFNYVVGYTSLQAKLCVWPKFFCSACGSLEKGVIIGVPSCLCVVVALSSTIWVLLPGGWAWPCTFNLPLTLPIQTLVCQLPRLRTKVQLWATSRWRRRLSVCEGLVVMVLLHPPELCHCAGTDIILMLSKLCCVSGNVCGLPAGFWWSVKFHCEWASLRKRMVLFWLRPGPFLPA